MPVVFDEVVGTVTPPAPATPPAQSPGNKKPNAAASDRYLRGQYHHWQQRQRRLYAD